MYRPSCRFVKNASYNREHVLIAGLLSNFQFDFFLLIINLNKINRSIYTATTSSLNTR
jgi:hypothetical protein